MLGENLLESHLVSHHGHDRGNREPEVPYARQAAHAIGVGRDALESHARTLSREQGMRYSHGANAVTSARGEPSRYPNSRPTAISGMIGVVRNLDEIAVMALTAFQATLGSLDAWPE